MVQSLVVPCPVSGGHSTQYGTPRLALYAPATPLREPGSSAQAPARRLDRAFRRRPRSTHRPPPLCAEERLVEGMRRGLPRPALGAGDLRPGLADGERRRGISRRVCPEPVGLCAALGRPALGTRSQRAVAATRPRDLPAGDR